MKHPQESDYLVIMRVDQRVIFSYLFRDLETLCYRWNVHTYWIPWDAVLLRYDRFSITKASAIENRPFFREYSSHP